eukprot:Pgem_evm1s12416
MRWITAVQQGSELAKSKGMEANIDCLRFVIIVFERRMAFEMSTILKSTDQVRVVDALELLNNIALEFLFTLDFWFQAHVDDSEILQKFENAKARVAKTLDDFNNTKTCNTSLVWELGNALNCAAQNLIENIKE